MEGVCAWILLCVGFCTLCYISRQKKTGSQDHALHCCNDFNNSLLCTVGTVWNTSQWANEPSRPARGNGGIRWGEWCAQSPQVCDWSIEPHTAMIWPSKPNPPPPPLTPSLETVPDKLFGGFRGGDDFAIGSQFTPASVENRCCHLSCTFNP